MEVLNKKPLYVKTKIALRNYIYEHKDCPLPGERELVLKLGVSRTTIRKAIQELSAEGLLKAIHGKGTFYTPPERRISSDSVLLVFENSFQAYSREIFTAMTQALPKKKFYPLTIMAADSELAAEEIASCLDRVDSVILGPRLSESQAINDLLANSGKKLLVLRYRSRVYNYNFVEEDRELGFEMIANHLLDAGHRRIALLIYERDTARLNGIKKVFLSRGLRFPEELLINCPGVRACGYDAAERLLSKTRNFSAVIAHNDEAALGVMECLFRHGIRIPEDVSITGYDNIAESERFPVALSTCGASPELIVKEALNFISSIKNEMGFRKILKPQFIARDSVMKIKGE